MPITRFKSSLCKRSPRVAGKFDETKLHKIPVNSRRPAFKTGFKFSGSKAIAWTHHAQAKMKFYRLSEARVRRVLNAPKRTEEGVAPKTIAMMQPASIIFKINKDAAPAKAMTSVKSNYAWNNKTSTEQTWSQEIWVMVEDSRDKRTIVSAWRYPGKTKPKSAIALAKMREEYRAFAAKRSQDGSDAKKMEKSRGNG